MYMGMQRNKTMTEQTYPTKKLKVIPATRPTSSTSTHSPTCMCKECRRKEIRPFLKIEKCDNCGGKLQIRADKDYLVVKCTKCKKAKWCYKCDSYAVYVNKPT